MSSIDGVGGRGIQATDMAPEAAKQEGPKASFGEVMGRVADGALDGVSKVAPFFPGGQLVAMAADGLRALKGSAPAGMASSESHSQMNQMFEMQKESQAFNLQYLQLQTELQNDNRRFSTLTNLMKVRHDTAKSAINNMHA